MTVRTLDTLPLHPGARVLVRCDFNVPLHEGVIADDGRIRAALPTLRELLGRGAVVIAASHLGRPKGQVVPELSLAPVAARLGELLDLPVPLLALDEAPDRIDRAAPGSVFLLENLRFSPAETSAEEPVRRVFAQQLADLADAVVSDGFGVVHREQASCFDLERLRPSAAGRLVCAELSASERLLNHPERPYTVVLGGSKVSDKLGVIRNLLPQIDRLLIGGGMAFTFLAAMGSRIGASLCEPSRIDDCLEVLRSAEAQGVEVLVPTDIRTATEVTAEAAASIVPVTDIESGPGGDAAIGLDIGPETEARFAEAIHSSRTVFWNGPMGMFELPAFASGTLAIARALRDCTGFTMVGGGDSAAAVRQAGFSESDFSHISTGGGASLELLEGKALPGLTVLGWSL